MSNFRPAIPVLGYPSQSAAVRALYREGNEAFEIAEMTGISINSVHRALAGMRRKIGVKAMRKKPRQALPPATSDAWPATAHEWRVRNYVKAANGAREALEAMRQ